MTHVGPPNVPVGVCLQCGQAKSALKRGDSCATAGGYEYLETIEEWPQHRWRGWTDAELGRFGIKPEAFDRYHRADLSYFEWMPCDDSVRGHNPATRDDPEWGVHVGDCLLCGKRGVATDAPVS